MSNPVSTEISRVTDALSLCGGWCRVRSAHGCRRPSQSRPSGGPPERRAGRLRLRPAAMHRLRWHSVSANVISGIVDSDILDDRDQDRLADELLGRSSCANRHPCGGSARPPSNTTWTHRTGPDGPPRSEHPRRPRTVSVAAGTDLGCSPRPQATPSVSRRRDQYARSSPRGTPPLW